MLTNEQLAFPDEVLLRLGRLYNSFTLRYTVPVLQPSAQRTDSWQLELLKEVHEGFQLHKPDRYILDCIYYFARAAKEYGATYLGTIIDPDWREMFTNATDTYRRQFFSNQAALSWLKHDDGKQLSEFCPQLLDLLDQPEVDINANRDRIEDGRDEQMYVVGESLCLALDCYLTIAHDSSPLRD